MVYKQFTTGDYVRFINEKQEGTVSKILPNGNIIVDIEDGFPIEVTPGEIVKVQENIIEKSRNEPQKNTEINGTPELEFPAPEAFRIQGELRLLVVPTHGKVTTGSLKLYLLNMLSTDIVYTLSTEQNRKHTGKAAGLLKSKSHCFLTEIRREELIDFDAFHFTGLQHSTTTHSPSPVLRKSFQLPLPDLQQPFPFLLSHFAFTKSEELFRESTETEEDTSALIEKLKNEYTTGKIQTTSPRGNKVEKRQESEQQYLRQFGLSSGEIDLHIEELTPNIAGLSNAEIITLQLQHFRKELDKAILRKAHRIVFIHGVGNGRLKAEIRKELKDAGLKFKDADPSRYGAGATEVLF